jgi:hypothetical protein
MTSLAKSLMFEMRYKRLHGSYKCKGLRREFTVYSVTEQISLRAMRSFQTSAAANQNFKISANNIGDYPFSF